MAPQPNPTNQSNNSGCNGSNGGSIAPSSPSSPPSPPFHSRTSTVHGRRNGGRGSSIYYQPSVHQLTCRGAFHLKPRNDGDKHGKDGAGDSGEGDDNLEALVRDAFLCNGIQTRLRHVADYPLARTREEAVQWFGGGGGSLPSALGVGGAPGILSNNPNLTGNENIGGSKNNNNLNEGGSETVDMDSESTFSSYGTTQMNILTLQEVPVVIAQDDPLRSRSLMEDPFGGFGALAPSGMLNPFGSLFGGFFGGDMADPWSQHPGEDVSNNNSGWMRGSRSVSSSTRTDRDEDGKRVLTTITKTTTVDGEGNRRTETVITKRHVDDGGRVETEKVVQEDKKDGNGSSSKRNRSGGAADSSNGNNDKDTIPMPMPRTFDGMLANHPSLRTAVAVRAPQGATPEAPSEVAAISTACLMGVSVSDSPTVDPESPVPRINHSKEITNKGNGVGWRKTEYLFQLGRFIPPFMVVNVHKYDKEEEERRRREMQREYDDMRDRLKMNRWGGSASRHDGNSNDAGTDGDESKSGKNTNNNIVSTIANNTSDRTKYYLQRIYVQMSKNLNMMGVLLHEMTRPDFPKKVQVGGTKILENMGPTAERTGKLMKDVWEMWTGSGDGGGGWNNSGGEGGAGAGRR